MRSCDAFALACTFGIFLAAASGCLQSGPPSHRIIARVATRPIHEDDVYYRQLQQIAENPQDAKQYSADPTLVFRQLVQSVILLETMERHGMAVTREVLVAEYDRMRTHSKFPEQLQEFRQLFLSEEMFMDVYVMPVYVARVCYADLFLARPRFHRHALEEANKADYSAWLNQEAALSPIQCENFELCDRFKAEYASKPMF